MPPVSKLGPQMGSPDLDHGMSDGSNAALWRLIRKQAHHLATLRHQPTDRDLDDFTRLVELLPAPRGLNSAG